MTEVVLSPETSAHIRTAWRYIPENGIIDIYMFQLVLFTSVKPVPTLRNEVTLIDVQPDFDYKHPSEK
jgi:hypothetical protein